LRNALVASTAIIGLALLATDLDQIDSRAAKEIATAIAAQLFRNHSSTSAAGLRFSIADILEILQTGVLGLALFPSFSFQRLFGKLAK